MLLGFFFFFFLDSLSSLRKEQLCGGGECRIQKWVKWKRAKILQIYKEQQTEISLRKGRSVCCEHSPGRSVRGNGNCAPLCRAFFHPLARQRYTELLILGGGGMFL